MAKLTLKSLDSEIQQLPSLSVIVMEVLSLIEKGDVNLPVLMKKIAQDQALAARVLKVANSPFYGFSRNIASLKDAGIMLGIHTVQHIVTAAGIIGHFSAEENQCFDRAAFWQHSIGTGICAKMLANHCSLDQETAFTAGLLHDIGKLVMAVHFSDDFQEILGYRNEHDCLLKDAEKAVLDFDHSVVGAKITEHWKLPPLIVSAIKFHHRPGLESVPSFAMLVHIADIVCRGLEIGNGGDTLIPVMQNSVMKLIGLDWNIIQNSLSEIEELNASATILLEQNTTDIGSRNEEVSGARNIAVS